ncbi:MAG: pyridoxal phosphate-dependent aminotransferase [Deltaproteobacteria bacterium]|nr:pyridoxal phosphate-dependent aminotransferase [Deltaproteobacteria bacterium]
MPSTRSRVDSVPATDEGFRAYLDRRIADRDVIDLLVAFPGFEPPAHIREAFQRAAGGGFFHYGESRGLLPLREAIARQLEAEKGIEADPEREIVVTSGASGALFTAVWTFADRADEVILPDPTFQMITKNVVMAGAKPVFIPFSADLSFPVERLARAVSSRTRMICLVNPENPTGMVYPEEVLQEIARIACEQDLLVLTDEVHDRFVYEGRHLSIAALPGMKERTILVNSFSKAYGIGGLRVGYAVMPPALLELFLRLHRNDNPHPCIAAQAAAQAAAEGPQDFLREWREECRPRRDYCVEALNGIEGVSCRRPQSGIVLFPDVSARGSSEEVARLLADRARVAVHPGSRYGPAGEGHLRICFGSVSFPLLREAMERIREALR